MFRSDRLALGLAAVATVVMVAAAPAVADDARAIKRVEDLNRAAMEDYDLLEFDSAKKQLGDALALIKKSKLDKHKVAARTHMNLAIVYGGGIGDQDTALLELMSALEIDPAAKLDPAYRSPALQKTFEQARSSVGGGSAESAAPSAVAALKLNHTPVEEAKAGEPLIIIARAGGEILERATQVVLRYRPAGAEAYTGIPMQAQGGGEYQGTIPEAATRGDTVHYFVEARAATGKVLATAGTLDAPNVVSLVRPKGARRLDDPADEEDPLNRRAATPDSGSGVGEDATEVARKPAGRPHKLYVSVAVGSGAGYISGGETEVSHQAVTCCVAVAPFHIMPEVGLWITPRLTLSLVGRIGFPLGANVAGAATLAPAVLARATYLFASNGSGPYVHGDLGGGFIRHTVKLTAMSSTTAMGTTDTFVTGPLLVGGGAGWILPLGKGPLRVVIDLNVLAGIPIIDTIGSGSRASEPGFAINGDLSLGMGVAF